MAIGNSQKLELRTGQSLVLTPLLQQSLKILQFSSLDLNNYIAEELEKNPLLISGDDDEKESGAEKPASEETPAAEENMFDAGGREAEVDLENVWNASETQVAREDMPSDSYNITSYSGGGRQFDGDEDGFEQTLSEEKSLHDYIFEQINLDIISPAQKIIALHLIDMLDESGYITGDFTEIAKTLNCQPAHIEEVLVHLQKCEPVGIFARSLPECLALQLKDKNRFDPAMEKLLANLELLAKKDLTRLEKICQVSKEDLAEMIAEIKSLNPKPASDFSKSITETVLPDVFLKKNSTGNWIVELNPELLPKLLVNKKYYSEIAVKTNDTVQKKYLNDSLSTANWLIKTLSSRSETILKVVTEIVAAQKDFFDKGIMHLKPMTLKDISEKIGMHESTVSRVTSNKYLQTPFAIYELKYFFTSSVGNTAGGASEDAENSFSSQTVKHLIRQLIDNEENNIFSDDKLVSMLKEKGIDIARRTVAKYRESLKIPSSAERKRQKAV